MAGGELSIDWDGLAPHIEHQTREGIVEAVRWIGPLSVPDLKGVLEDCGLAHVSYHLTVLLREEVLAEVDRRPAGGFREKIYSFISA